MKQRLSDSICAGLLPRCTPGLVHRDVKAANVMREHGGRIVLMDFGTGQDLGQVGPEGRMAGTPLYPRARNIPRRGGNSSQRSL